MRPGIIGVFGIALLFGATSVPAMARHRPVSVNRVPEGKPEVRVFSLQGEQRGQFIPQEVTSHRNLTLAVGNVSGDEQDEIIIGQGSGAAPLVYVYNGTGKLLTSFFAYPGAFKGGVRVTTGDLDGDGLDEIITAPGPGGGPHVRIFTGTGDVAFHPGFYTSSREDAGGLFVGTVDADGDGASEILVGSGVGRRGEVQIYDRRGSKLNSFFATEEVVDGVEATGFSFAGRASHHIALSVVGSGVVEIYEQDGKRLEQFAPYGEITKVSVRTVAADLDRDGDDDLITSSGLFGGPRIRGFSAFGIAFSSPDFFAFDKDFLGGAYAGVGNVRGLGRGLEIVALQENLPESAEIAEKFIEVDLSEQTLYAFERGFLKYAFLISSGKAPLGTPEGRFKVNRKKPLTRMTWVYGKDDPKNYDLPNVPWMTAFFGPYTIHGTYWHNNFGHPMSHGCVNMRTSEAKMIYEFAPMGTDVWVHQ